jgi:hypothetical protein
MENQTTGVSIPSSVGKETGRLHITANDRMQRCSSLSTLKTGISHRLDTRRVCCAQESESALIPGRIATLPTPGISAHGPKPTLRPPSQ